MSEEEINAIEEHRFRPLDHLYWRSSDLDFTTVTDLIASLEARSDDPLLRPAPLAIDLAVLKLLAEDPVIAATQSKRARKLWAVCGLPDFRKVGPMHHARMVRRLFSYIGEGGHIPHEWFAAEVARLDRVEGDIEALADRLAGIRSWAYIAQRSDWLADPAKWAERTRAVEGRLSDALHERLTQRFVDRRGNSRQFGFGEAALASGITSHTITRIACARSEIRTLSRTVIALDMCGVSGR